MSVFFLCVHGEWIVARNKQIAREPLRGSRDLFVPRYDSYPHEPRKKDTHSLSAHFNFAYHTNKAPYNKSLRQARFRWLWHLWLYMYIT